MHCMQKSSEKYITFIIAKCYTDINREHLLYLENIENVGNIALLNLETQKVTILQKGFSEPEIDWSPDGKWLVFSREDNEFNSDIFLISVKNPRKVYNISRHPDFDGRPIWSPNGRWIAFTSRRNNNDLDIWLAYLQKEDWERPLEEWDGFCKKEKEKKNLKAKGKKKKVRVRIQFSKLYLRCQQLTRWRAEETPLAFSKDSKYLYFASNLDEKGDLYRVSLPKKKITRLTTNHLAPKEMVPMEKGFLILNQKGSFYQWSTSNKAVILPYRIQTEILRPLERKYVFLEAWDWMDRFFYDVHFHGRNWQSVKKKYGLWTSQILHDRDFYHAMNMMLGELNSSHVGLYGPRPKALDVTGVLGIRFHPVSNGFQVDWGLPKSPADHSSSRLYKGDIIRSVEGNTLTGRENFYSLFRNKVNKEVWLQVERKTKIVSSSVKKRPGKNKNLGETSIINIYIRPISPQREQNLLYQNWVERNRKLVSQLSGGKLAYLHIRGMGWANVEQFERELFSEAHNKKGLLIDVRYNGGGWTADYLLAILMVKPHAFTVPRSGGKGYPQGRLPYYKWTLPAITLCNEYSFSNAEIFSHAFKTLKRGLLVGKTTYGGVISTGGTRLLDGSYLRLPFRGWYLHPSGQNMENHGAKPDVVVENPPGEEIAGQDRQLKKAVKLLLSQLN
ncbi:MAG: hypothetical protein D6785_05950 [Planctomycetota bacterium]|nr:MAG: hypothetical protein D6785_05950 [Planctomycetota bacterium]